MSTERFSERIIKKAIRAKPLESMAEPIEHRAEPVDHLAVPLNSMAEPIQHRAEPIAHRSEPLGTELSPDVRIPVFGVYVDQIELLPPIDTQED